MTNASSSPGRASLRGWSLTCKVPLSYENNRNRSASIPRLSNLIDKSVNTFDRIHMLAYQYCYYKAPPSFTIVRDAPAALLALQSHQLAMVVYQLARRTLLGVSVFLASSGSISSFLPGSVSKIAGSGAGSVGISQVNGQYLLGLGIGDITGPVVETNMMGYASLAQTDSGLHMRQRSRAFIVAEADNPSNRILFINSDIAMGDTGVRRTIVSSLTSLYPGIYTNENIAFVGTHQHSGVGGYLENLLPQLTALGYVNASASAIITGTNPEEERARYEFDQDKDMTVVRFDDENGAGRGFLSFFAVHGTSLYENNTLVSADNKGMAAFLYENMIEPDAMPGNTTFVAGFVQANVGDTSPNTDGAFCESPGEAWDGQPCEFEHSTCGNKTEDCHGRGPGFRISDFESNRIIGELQFEGAKSVMESSLVDVAEPGAGRTKVTGPVRSVHVYLNMSFHEFTLANGSTARTCPPALGFGFAGGTTDGPGAFDFIQGANTSEPQNPFWEIVKGAVTPQPNAEQAACQSPKPILLNTGYAHFPYEWSPSTVDIQLMRVGNFVMLIMPGELTTMSGRRMREAVRAELISKGIIGDDAYVVIAGPANTYAHYVATREEYSVQRYEGASTLFGPFTLEAYIDKYTSLVPFLAENPTGTPASDAPPVEQTSKAISLQTGVVFDGVTPFSGKNFGDVSSDGDVRTSSAYSVGDTVRAWFIGANPRNNLRLEQTFLSVEHLTGSNAGDDGSWTMVRSDSHPSTTFEWVRNSTILGTSTVTISWNIENGTPSGSYRLRYFGDSKALDGNITPFVGTSSTFMVA
ncbi:Neutral alkaline nonlysosomal ceramidase [Pyrrhoderma noxium]|uniref:Neutral ceramidase n=1 Tax=Pyrrhoderma noxium TaxID=2282107 RepID=A0A286UU30_9AGAM|nr:Neutral alkaline nonlysosomal ceramidase [Pyrrhoderma noxium]